MPPTFPQQPVKHLMTDTVVGKIHTPIHSIGSNMRQQEILETKVVRFHSAGSWRGGKSAFRFLFISVQEALTEWMNSDMNNSYSCSRVWMEIGPWALLPQMSVWNVPPPFAQHTAFTKTKSHQIMPDGESFWQCTTKRQLKVSSFPYWRKCATSFNSLTQFGSFCRPTVFKD